MQNMPKAKALRVIPKTDDRLLAIWEQFERDVKTSLKYGRDALNTDDMAAIAANLSKIITDACNTAGSMKQELER